MKTKPRSPKCDLWKPVRSGETYCSPACGYGCTYESYLEAHIKAERLARQCGPNWEPYIWENLGWHYSAHSKNNLVKVHPYSGGAKGYTVFFGWPDGPGGDFTAHGTGLKTTIRSGLETARETAKKANDLVRELETVCL